MTGSKGYIAKAVAAMNKDVYGGKLILLDWTRGYDLGKSANNEFLFYLLLVG